MGFSGGYKFKKFEGTAEPILNEQPIPEKVVIVFFDVDTDSFSPTVSDGAVVRAGEKILESKGEAKISLSASVNGTVSLSGDGISIQSDGSDSFVPVEGHTREPIYFALPVVHFCAATDLHRRAIVMRLNTLS